MSNIISVNPFKYTLYMPVKITWRLLHVTAFGSQDKSAHGRYAVSDDKISYVAEASLGLPDDLQLIRIRSKKHEIIIAPEFSSGKEYQLVVVQNPVAD